MKYKIKVKITALFVGLMTIIYACSSESEYIPDDNKGQPKEVITAQGISVPVYDFYGFEHMIDFHRDTLYVFNFWATWCQPCVRELPYFNAADSVYAEEPVRIILVSIDFVDVVEGVLIPFIIDNELRPEVIVLDEMDANSWIPLIDPDWQGNIPATLFKMSNRQNFIASELSYEELSKEIENFINP